MFQKKNKKIFSIVVIFVFLASIMSLEEMDYQQELDKIKYATSNIYFVGKSAFDL